MSSDREYVNQAWQEEQEVDSKELGVEHLEDSQDTRDIGRSTQQADFEETPLGALRKHKMTMLWIFYAIWVLVACSFDNNASSNILAIPAFRKDFGYEYQGSYVLYAKWQSAYSGGPSAATVVGAFAAGCE
jgi:SP family general alpha glucoside:H+ symporter-like MFS transporter